MIGGLVFPGEDCLVPLVSCVNATTYQQSQCACQSSATSEMAGEMPAARSLGCGTGNKTEIVTAV
eukprot:COSAG02_NODE_3388_length_6828_cov_19.910685_1_plen_65_part_00